MTLEQIITPESQRIEIVKYLDRMSDNEAPMIYRLDCQRRCERILRNYKGVDYDSLWDNYLIEKGRMK